MACQGEIVYLHGWNGHPSCDKLTECLPDGIVLTLPTYHPGGNTQETKIKSFLEELRSRALNNGPFLALVGYSFGGLLAALFQEKFPHLVKRVVLLAPAIDNFRRNYENLAESVLDQKPHYVKELRDLKDLQARPTIRVPAVVIHGQQDTDAGGSELWRVEEWTGDDKNKQLVARRFFPKAGHDLQRIVSAEGSLSWALLAHWAVRGDAVVLPYYANVIDGEVGSETAYALQRFLLDQKFIINVSDIDCNWGDKTSMRFQEFVYAQGFKGPTDGNLRNGQGEASNSTRACQKWLSWVGHPPNEGVDGDWGKDTVKALQRFLAQARFQCCVPLP